MKNIGSSSDNDDADHIPLTKYNVPPTEYNAPPTDLYCQTVPDYHSEFGVPSLDLGPDTAIVASVLESLLTDPPTANSIVLLINPYVPHPAVLALASAMADNAYDPTANSYEPTANSYDPTANTVPTIRRPIPLFRSSILTCHRLVFHFKETILCLNRPCSMGWILIDLQRISTKTSLSLTMIRPSRRNSGN
jgi:hypothetical protein